jgi:flagellar biosynthesis GTPase FlhF
MTYSVRWTDSEALAMGTCCFVANSVREVYKRFRSVYGDSARITSLRVTLC